MVRPGLINLDFADVEHVMSSMGKAMMGTGEAEGEGRAAKAAEVAIANQLIDDYFEGCERVASKYCRRKRSKLFEVDEAVNKVRAEVDPEAELIIGAITDTTLEGIMRVSIVATALDGQQPESKSVINMVHGIQNRNPGYHENSSVIQKNTTLNNNHTNFISNTSGANALQVDNEDIKETENDLLSSMIDENMALNSSSTIETNNDNIIHEQSPLELDENSEVNQNQLNQETSNGLENFDLIEETPHLFNSNNEVENETIPVSYTH